MSRLASIIGLTNSGKWEAIAAGDAHEMELIREAIRKNNGVIRKGAKEIELSELRILANHTAGGELKGRLKFK